MSVFLFLKSHIDTYTRKDGVTIQAHDDKRQAHKYNQYDHVEHTDGTVHVVHHHIGDKVRTYSGKEFDASKLKPAKDWRDEENWHTRTMAKMRTHSEAELRGIHKDATEAAELGKKMGNRKSGQYRDEAHYAAMEIQRRRKASA